MSVKVEGELVMGMSSGVVWVAGHIVAFVVNGFEYGYK